MVRNGTFYARIWVPTDVAPIYGKQLVVTSLRTKDLKTAKSRLARKSVEVEDAFDAIRLQRAADHDSTSLPGSVDRQRLLAVARKHAATACDREFVRRADLFSKATQYPSRFWRGEFGALPSPADFGHGDEDAYTYFDHLVAQGDLEKVLGFVNRFRLKMRIAELRSMRAIGNLAEFRELADNLSPALNPQDAVVLARLLIDEELAALQAVVAGEPYTGMGPAGADRDPPASNLPPAHSQMAEDLAQRETISLDNLFERWEAEMDPSASTLSSWRGIVRDLRNSVREKADDIALITPNDIIAWKDKLVRANKAPATISRGYLGCARALFRFALANRLVSTDPTQGIVVTRKAKPGTKMLGYTGEEVAHLLTLATEATEPWRKWLPWLAAATGSRIGEVAQLHGSHVFEQDGMHVVKIAPAVDGGSIKNAESERIVPLHPAIIEAGFLDFVRERGQGPLFYRRSSGDPKRKHASKGVANRLASWIRESGFSDPRKAPNHALRHWFKSEAARVGIPDSVADAIQGHSDASSAGRYRHIGLDVMAKALAQIELPPSR